jgi:predicted secreted protein
VKDWSLSVNGVVSIAQGGSQQEFYEAFQSGEPLALGIFLDEDTYFGGRGIVSSYNISGAPDDAINLSSEIAGTGATVLVLP